MSFKHIILITLFIGMAATGFYYLDRPTAITVKLYTIQAGEVKETVSNTRVGTVKACRRAFLAPGTGGEVVRLNAHEGDEVKHDQILLEVWNDGLKAQVVLAGAAIESAQAEAQQACLRADLLAREARRLVRLQKRKKKIVSDEAVDAGVTAAAIGRAACQSARSSIAVANAQLQVANSALERTIVRAPFDGIVAEVNAELGEFVTPSPPGIPTLPPIDLIDTACLYISAPIDEVDAPKVALGMPACVSLDAFPSEQRCSGRVSRIAPYVLEKEK